jgi:hypothetical protein
MTALTLAEENAKMARKLKMLMKYGIEEWEGYGEAVSAFLEEELFNETRLELTEK